MRFLARLRNLVSARVHALLTRLEDPECMARQALQELEDGLDELRQQAAMAVAAERRLARELDRQQTQVQGWKEKARLALDQGREDLARWALARGLQQRDSIADLHAQHDAAQQASTEVKQALQTLQDRLAQAQRQHLVLVARQRTAKVRHAAQQALGSGDDIAGTLSTKLAKWEERLTESADVLLALVEVGRPGHEEQAELAALKVHRRIEGERAALKRESEALPLLSREDRIK